MAVFDTSALLPLFIQGHPNGDAARSAFNDADLVLLHPCVIEEFTRVLRRLSKDAGHDGNQAARTALRSLLDEPRVRIHADLAYTSAVDLYDGERGRSFTDAVVSALAHAYDGGVPVGFDSVLRREERAPAKRAKRRPTRA